MTTPNGALLVDKSGGMTSHDVVAHLRKIFTIHRVGHAGTLDPMATGLLVVAVGSATRLLRFAQVGVKRYSGAVQWGVATDSLDADGVVVATASVPTWSPEEIDAVIQQFTGTLEQIPPMVSALKVDGRRLHALAREGKEVERVPRSITVDSLTLSASLDPTVWHFDVTCSSGTYVRVLLADVATRLGTLGHLTTLRRESSGSLSVDNALTLDEIHDAVQRGDSPLMPPRVLVSSLPSVSVTGAEALALRQGKKIPLSGAPSDDEIAAFDDAGVLVGVLERRGDVYKPNVIMPPR